MGVTVVNKTVCVTGEVPGLSRAGANKKLQEAGAHTVSTVTRNTHMLVTGAKVGPRKIENAEKLGVAIVPWEDIAWDGNGDEPVLIAQAPAPKALSFIQVQPMKAVSGDLADTLGGEWLYEIKWDGNRAVAHVENGAVAIQSGSAKTDFAKRYPRIAEALAEWSLERPAMGAVVLDGEIIVPEEEGGSFQALANWQANSGSAVFVVFDVLECGGRNLRQLPFSERRDLMEAMIPEGGSHVILSPTWEDGQALLDHAVERGLEGIMAKPLNSTYREGHRGPWMKLKVRCSQEFAVLGYTPGSGHVEGGIGALILGYHDDTAGGFVLCGEAGTGYTKQQRFQIREALDQTADPDAEQDVAMEAKYRRKLQREGAVWVKPTLVAQVEFQRWTNDERLWHPSFQGFREDKEPHEARREA
jgi:bifunctional non-homologous end joining protein LigD